MTHYLMIQFRDNYFTDEVYADFQDAFAEMVWDLDGVQQVSIKPGERMHNQNADIMIKIGLRDMDALGLYMPSDNRCSLLARHGHYIKYSSEFNTEQSISACA